MNEFKTNSLPFAALLLSEKILKYLRTETLHRHRIFVFADPDNRGPSLEADFYNGSPVTAIKPYNDAIKMLLEKFVPAGGVHAPAR